MDTTIVRCLSLGATLDGPIKYPAHGKVDDVFILHACACSNNRVHVCLRRMSPSPYRVAHTRAFIAYLVPDRKQVFSVEHASHRTRLMLTRRKCDAVARKANSVGSLGGYRCCSAPGARLFHPTDAAAARLLIPSGRHR